MAGDSPPPPGRAAGPAAPRAPRPAARPAGPAPAAAAPGAYWLAAGAAGFRLAAPPANRAASPRPPAQQAGLHSARGERSRYVSGRERDSILSPRYPPAPGPAAANRGAPPPPRPSGYRGGAARRALSSAVGSCRPPALKGAGARGALWGRSGPVALLWPPPLRELGSWSRGEPGPGSTAASSLCWAGPRRAASGGLGPARPWGGR